MAGNNKIQFLRGTKTKRLNSAEKLNAGQPFFETDTGILYVGTGETLESAKPVCATSIEHTHNYASSKTPAGPADSANKLNSTLTLVVNEERTEFDGSSSTEVTINTSSSLYIHNIHLKVGVYTPSKPAEYDELGNVVTPATPSTYDMSWGRLTVVSDLATEYDAASLGQFLQSIGAVYDKVSPSYPAILGEFLYPATGVASIKDTTDSGYFVTGCYYSSSNNAVVFVGLNAVPNGKVDTGAGVISFGTNHQSAVLTDNVVPVVLK